MFQPETRLSAPPSGQDYLFPFAPYDIQLDLMRSLYSVVESGQVGIFESPTGTGKSLTLTCAVLSWLRDHEALMERELVERIDRLKEDIAQLERSTAGAVDWISGQYETIGAKKQLSELKGVKDLRDEYYKRLQEIKEKTAEIKKKRNFSRIKKESNDGPLLEADSDGTVGVEEDYMVDSDDDDMDLADDDEGVRFRPVQVIFCSRTHSQLGQVVNEIRRTEFGKQIRLTTLASRQNLCINPEVKKLKGNSLINERCLELQKKSGKKITSVDDDKNAKKKRKVAGSCPFYNRSAIEELRNDALFEIQDIEELVAFSKQEKACPYYASRASVPDSQLLMVPYQNLLHRKTREQTGIDIRNSVIIIDEAHNLLDTISNIHSQEVTLEQLQQARLHINAYKTQYFPRFSTKNLLKINQLLFVATRLCKLLEIPSKCSSGSRMVKTHELMMEGDFFNLNLGEILQFAEKSRIAQKIHGFAQSVPTPVLLNTPNKRPNETKKGTNAVREYLKQLEKGISKPSAVVESARGNEKPDAEIRKESVPNAIRPLLAFLECLAESFDDGRVLMSYSEKDSKQSSMKYLLLNPGARFEEILTSCRSLILAGGTMQPVEELTEQLFKHCPERVQLRSYRHVVPPDAVLPLAISKGPSGKELLFNYNNRQNKELLNELASTLINICQVVPNGVVCFFSSYDYLERFFADLQESGRLARLEERKRVFREPRGSGNVEKVLADYSKAARQWSGSQTGALMLSVVGGKLSEGLNFADELGRCVVVVGLPYPNRTSPELVERMRYLDRTLKPSAGNEYYENLCMKAVNQCIGRAVRHINDYASVVLLDARYGSSEKIRKKLPVWISEGMKCVDRYGQAHGSLVKFFKTKNGSDK
ncbi:ATP-dependent DNA helicase DDX11 [Topomyia yanbarensis]|uniref:ATP-dependent DNA helicase DDX11 n=1 Tax=Topomyia yanbarensis TaxID=2498891 RepID=UPI00273B8DE9|nr:ATP-dependent DNA helicase DDX11 [Topomyia yanbarensis]